MTPALPLKKKIDFFSDTNRKPAWEKCQISLDFRIPNKKKWKICLDFASNSIASLASTCWSADSLFVINMVICCVTSSPLLWGLSTCRTFFVGGGEKRRTNYTHTLTKNGKETKKGEFSSSYNGHQATPQSLSLLFSRAINELRRTYTHTCEGGGWGAPKKWAVLSTWRFFFFLLHRGLLAQGGS